MNALYAPPAADFDPSVGRLPLETDAVVTPAIAEALLGTRPWVLFLAILGFIGTGLMLLGSLGILVAASQASVPFAGALASGYVVLAAMYAAGSWYLASYARNIALLRRGYGVQALEHALRSQHAFWRFTGIATIVLMVLYGIFVVAIGMGAMREMQGLQRDDVGPPEQAIERAG